MICFRVCLMLFLVYFFSTALCDQLVLFLDENSKQDTHMNSSTEKEAAEDKKENDLLHLELKKSQEELEKCIDNLNSCLEKNSKNLENVELKALLEMQKPVMHDQDGGIEVIKTNSDFDAKPMVMLLGQYSIGKTTFIKLLLKCNYPGAHIGPEPTTDGFIVVMLHLFCLTHAWMLFPSPKQIRTSFCFMTPKGQ